MPHSRLVLTLLRRDAGNAWRSLSRSDAAWIGGGGGLLLAYAVADVWLGLLTQAPRVRADQGLWLVRGPLGFAAAGGALGYVLANLSARRALAPFLRALPIADAARWRMVGVAGSAVGAVLTLAVLGTVTLAAVIVEKPWAIGWGLIEAAAFAIGYAAAFLLRGQAVFRTDGVALGAAARRRLLLPGPGLADGGRMPWVGGWAWGLSAGRVPLTFRRVVTALALALLTLFAAIGSIARHEGAASASVGLLGGFLVFMLTARYAPLLSPVMRTAPVGFGRAWRRLTRLPLVLSGAFFAVSATAASAAEPGTAAARVADGVGLVILDASYAVFAAYFATSPILAAAGFFAAVLYAFYEASEFGGAMVIGFGGLLALLWSRTRRRFQHG